MRPMRLKRLLAFDRKQTGKKPQVRIAGVDEAGRGPLAGPVVASAVILLRMAPGFQELNDSKQVSVKNREALFYQICSNAVIGIGVVDEKKIDEINILEATRLAMKSAVLALSRTPEILLIDGTMKLNLPLDERPIVEGDAKSASIAAASIIAKVFRDALMRNLDNDYPGYLFKENKGYPTPQHLKSLRRKGPCAIHRFSFAPVREVLFNHQEVGF